MRPHRYLADSGIFWTCYLVFLIAGAAIAGTWGVLIAWIFYPAAALPVWFLIEEPHTR